MNCTIFLLRSSNLYVSILPVLANETVFLILFKKMFNVQLKGEIVRTSDKFSIFCSYSRYFFNVRKIQLGGRWRIRDRFSAHEFQRFLNTFSRPVFWTVSQRIAPNPYCHRRGVNHQHAQGNGKKGKRITRLSDHIDSPASIRRDSSQR